MQKQIKNMFFVSEIIAFKLSVLSREYSSSTVNMLTNILKTSHITKRDFLQLSCLHREQKIW